VLFISRARATIRAARVAGICAARLTVNLPVLARCTLVSLISLRVGENNEQDVEEVLQKKRRDKE